MHWECRGHALGPYVQRLVKARYLSSNALHTLRMRAFLEIVTVVDLSALFESSLGRRHGLTQRRKDAKNPFN